MTGEVKQKTRVDIERVLEIQAERAKIDRLDLDEIELYHEGKPVTIQAESKDWWKFTGLGSIMFLCSLDLDTGTIPRTQEDVGNDEDD
jgi:hypothetical protein